MDDLTLVQSLHYTIDLKDGLAPKPMRSQLMKGDRKANRVIVEIKDGSEKADLSGVTVTGSFIRPPDGAEIPLKGSTDSNKAIVLLDDVCYTQEGYCEIHVKLTIGGTARTVLSLTGNVLSKGSGAVIDIGNVIPSIDDIIAQYKTMQEVTESTNAAKEAANTAAKYANSEAKKIDGLTVDAKSTDMPSAEVSVKNGVRHITFGLVTPNITFDVETGLPGTDAQIKASGTPEAPHLVLTIPRGNAGSINNMPFYNEAPKALGSEAAAGTSEYVSHGDHVHPLPTADQVGAVPSDGRAADSGRLDGKTWAELMLTVYPVGSIYMSVNEVNPGTLFGGTWEQLKDRFLLGAGDTYSNGKTGGASTVALTIDQMPKHRHVLRKVSASPSTDYDAYIATSDNDNDASSAETDGVRRYTTYEGGNESHNNMPPYLVINIWKRVS